MADEKAADRRDDSDSHLGLDEPIDAPSSDFAVSEAAPPDPPAVPTSEPKIIISPRLIAVVSFIFGVGCLASLAIVAAVRDADVLATTALALAIVAFGVQLLVSAAESQSSTQQSLRSEQLNTQTRALLAEMQTTARGTERMVREQFGQLLRAFMDAAKQTGGGKDFDPEAFEERLMANIRRDAVISGGAPESPAERSRAAEMLRRRRQQDAEAQEARKKAAGPFPIGSGGRPGGSRPVELAGRCAGPAPRLRLRQSPRKH